MARKLTLNTIMGILLRVVTILCGFILPRLILGHFGSEINGLVYSVTQFLGIISFLELGVGRVIQSALYQPLVRHDTDQISAILTSGSRFFRRLAGMMLVYVVVLIAVYPFVTSSHFGWMYTAVLIAAISISLFAQYYFGIIDSLLLNADQHGYVQYLAQIVTLILNVAVCAMLIRFDASIHMVKLASSVVFLIRPIYLRFYVNRHYKVNRNVVLQRDPIRQKWSGIAQHVSAVVLDNTDTIVLTLFSTLSNVSVYSVYNYVVFGVRQLYQSATEGLHVTVGNLWAKGEKEKLGILFGGLEAVLHLITVFLFSCTGVLLLPFIRVYTAGIQDTNYLIPVFGALMVLGRGIQCLRTTYNMLILAAGHYQQTQRCHIIAAGMNLVLSLALVHSFGLVGVAVGTVAALMYQTVWMAVYSATHLLIRPLMRFAVLLFADAALTGLILASTRWLSLSAVTYGGWFLLAMEVTAIAAAITVMFGWFFFRGPIRGMLNIWRTGKAK